MNIDKKYWFNAIRLWAKCKIKKWHFIFLILLLWSQTVKHKNRNFPQLKHEIDKTLTWNESVLVLFFFFGCQNALQKKLTKRIYRAKMASRIELNSEHRQNCITSELKSSESEYGKKRVTRETKKHGDNTNLRKNERKRDGTHKHTTRTTHIREEAQCQKCVYIGRTTTATTVVFNEFSIRWGFRKGKC